MTIEAATDEGVGEQDAARALADSLARCRELVSDFKGRLDVRPGSRFSQPGHSVGSQLKASSSALEP